MRTLNTIAIALVLVITLATTAQAAKAKPYRELTITWTKVSPEPITPTLDETTSSKTFDLYEVRYGALEDCNVFHADGSCSWSATSLVKSNDELVDEFQDDAMSMHDLKDTADDTIVIASH